ncbi:hypothetical protein FOCC_FOCC017347, partial [Frankliniella occidentalis]
MAGKGRGRHRLSLAGPVTLSADAIEVDWEKCVVCQTVTTDKLEDPGLNPIISRRSTAFMGIATKFKALAEFSYIMPSNLRVGKLDNGTGFENTLSTNKAKWHKSCISQFRDVPRFQALLKRLKEEQDKVADADAPPCAGEAGADGPGRQTRSAGVGPVHLKSNVCFLCKSVDSLENLHLCSTKEVHEHISESARKVGDTELLAILATADVIALEAKYHLKCLTKLYNKARRLGTRENKSDGGAMCEGIAFSDLAAYIHQKAEEGKAMKLADLVTMYQDRLAQLLGVQNEALPFLHRTRFREKIQAHFPSLRADKEGRDIVLRHISTSVLNNIHDEDQDEDALAFQRFFKSLRRTILDSRTTFEGDLCREKQKQCVPSALQAAINLLMYGSTVTPGNAATQPAVTIAQLVMLNLQKSVPQGNIVRNRRDLEAPFPLFLGLSTYGRSRCRTALDEMHKFGVSVSSDRIMEVTSNLCHLVTERAKEEGILCPSHLQEGRFTIGAYDNIDHNPTSRTSTGSFHGTSISIFQTGDVAGFERTLQTSYRDVAVRGRRSVPLLPEIYANIGGYALKSKEPSVPLRSPETAEKTSSEDVEMVRHGMILVRDLANRLNKVQIPVFCADLPLYRLARLVQWNSPDCDTLAENNFFVMLGPFHTEKAFLSVIGQFAENCGWKSIMSSSGIMTESAAETILKVQNVTKSRAAFQVTAAVLHSLLMDAYEVTAENQTLEEWVHDCSVQYPTFTFWLTFLELILLLLQFVKSLRCSAFRLYVDTLGEMLPWFFFFNHTHYSRWGTVHYMELLELPTKIPSLYDEFLKGKFVVHKSARAMSGLGVDQAHEQNNRIVKEEGGAIGLTQNPTALRRWMLAGPEITNLLQEFREEEDDEEDLLSHHEQRFSAIQKTRRNSSVLVHYNSAERKLKILTNVGSMISGNASVVSCLLGTSCADTAMEEADGRIILHAFDMIKAGHKDLLIRTVDTDVLVLAVSFYHRMEEQGLVTLWVKLGTGTHVKHYAAHEIAKSLGKDKAVALLGFHAFTGCDEVSFLSGHGKKSAWNKWNLFPEVTKAKTEVTDVNTVRRDLYDGVKPLASIPPSKDALHQHFHRAAYQAGQIWGQAHLPKPDPVDPTKWGWKMNAGRFEPLWSTLPDVWEKCQLKKKCHCKKTCTASRCPCKIAGIQCKVDCRCKGNCTQPPISVSEEEN